MNPAISLALLLVYIRYLEDRLADYESERAVSPEFERTMREAWDSPALTRQFYSG